jgi:hypothetical protein
LRKHKAKSVKVAGREETRIEEKIKHLKNTLRREELTFPLNPLAWFESSCERDTPVIMY